MTINFGSLVRGTLALRAFVLPVLLVLPPLSEGNAAPIVTITPLDGKVRVEIGGKLFTEYLHKDYAKPVLYPVIGPHDTPMTRKYPIEAGVEGEAEDHPHHRSLWFTHGDVNGVDFWGEGPGTGTIVHKKTIEVVSGTTTGILKTENHWTGPDGKIVCADLRTLTFFERDGGRVIDYEVTIRASHGDLVFGDTKEGSMGIRTHPALRLTNAPDKGVAVVYGKAVNSEGDQDKDLWGKKAKWVDYWAPIAGNTVGVAIFDHPENPVHPTWWHARDYGLIAANPFGVHDFEQKPPHTGDMKIEEGETQTFRYRFYFHRGDAREARIAENYQMYVSNFYDRRGDVRFKQGQFRQAIEDYDRAIELDSRREPHHWRRGIAYYYAHEYIKGQKQFEGYQTVDSSDVENVVWRYLCMAREYDVDKARTSLLKVGRDPRVPMKEIYELFAGRATPDDVLDKARAGKPAPEALTGRLFYAHLYLGLYHEAQSNAELARKHITLAADEYKLPGYMWEVARVHKEVLEGGKGSE